MKAKSVFLVVVTIGVLFTCTPSHAYLISLFSNVDRLVNHARDIVIAKCTVVPRTEENFGLFPAQVEVIRVLKGDKKIGPLKVATMQPLRPGAIYLLTSQGGKMGDIDFITNGELFTVPVADNFDLKTLNGLSIKEAFQMILSRHLYDVERALAPLLKEQALLTEGLADRTDDLFESAGNVKIGEIREVQTRVDDMSRYLDLDSKTLEWSEQAQGKSGYLYYTGGKRPAWEFAKTPHHDIAEFDGKPFKTKFHGYHSPGTSENAITVEVGDIILARTVNDPKTVYIIKFESQAPNKQLVTVRYVIVREEKDK